MNDWLDNPAVQAGLVPFVVALVLAALLARTRLLAAAAFSGLVVVVALTIGLSLEPLSSVKKLMLSAAFVTLVSLALEGAGIGPRRRYVVLLSALAGGAAVWVVWRVLQQLEPLALWGAGVAAFAFVFVTAGSALAAGAGSSLRGAVIGAVLGWGSGVLALLGASALLAQIGLGAGTACAAVALVQMLRGREAPLGWTLVAPAAAAASIIGVLASATGELRWYCLLPLPLAPLAAWSTGSAAQRPAWQRAFIGGIAAAVPVAVAIGLAWWSAAVPAAGA